MLNIAIGRIAQFALLLLTLRAATEFLLPIEIGKVSIVVSTVAFFALLLINPVGMFINRRMNTWKQKGLLVEYYGLFWRYILIVNLCAAMVLVTLHWFDIWKSSFEMLWFLLLICGNLIFATINQTVIPALNMFGYKGWFALLTVATVAVSLISAIIFVHTLLPSAEYWLCGLLFGQIAIGMLGKKILYKKLHHLKGSRGKTVIVNQHNIYALLNYAWPVSLAVGFGWIHSQGYRYLMENQLGLAELGLYVAGFGISAGLMMGVESILSTFLQPKFYKSLEDCKVDSIPRAWIEYAQIIIPSLLLFTIFLTLTASELTRIFLGVGFKQSSQFIVFGAAAEMGRHVTAIYSLAAHAHMKTKVLILPNFVGAVATIALLLLLVPHFGSLGVGFSMILASIAAMTVSAILTNQYFKIILPLKFIVKSAVMGLGLSVLYSVIKLIFNNEQSIIEALIVLGLIGLCYTVFQYFLLRPSFKNVVQN